MRRLPAGLCELPRPFWGLLAGTFVNRFGAFVLIFLVLWLTRQGYSEAQAGIALGAYALRGRGHARPLPGRGLLADRRAGDAGRVTSELYRPASAALVADLVPEGGA